MEIQLIYRELQKEYKLPPFSKLNDELEISCLEPSEFILRSIRRRFMEKMLFFSKIIESVIYPHNGSLVHMHESKFFEDGQKRDLADLYKKLAYLEKRSLELDIDSDEEGEVILINELYKELLYMKPKLREIIKVSKDGWVRNNKKFKETLYFG